MEHTAIHRTRLPILPYALPVIAAALCLLGCGGTVSRARAPAPDEFPPQELPFSLAGDGEAALRLIKAYLVDQDIPFVVTVREPRTFVVTAYRDEPPAPPDKRPRRTAIRFSIGDTGKAAAAPCTTVAITSLTISRGAQEDSWSTQSSDESYTSTAWPNMKSFLKKSLCP
jgi:hypothetical protein